MIGRAVGADDGRLEGCLVGCRVIGRAVGFTEGTTDGLVVMEGASEGVFIPLSPIITSNVTEHIFDRYSFNSSLIESGFVVSIPDTSKEATLP